MRKKVSYWCVIIFIFSTLLLGCQRNISEDLSSVEIEIQYSADSLISTLQSEKKHNLEAVIAVSGTVYEVNTINKRVTILLKGNETQETFVICDMNTNHSSSIKTIKKGDSVLIKGLLKGLLKDVIMLNCIIIKNE